MWRSWAAIAQYPDIVRGIYINTTYVGADAQTVSSRWPPHRAGDERVDNMNYMYSLNATTAS